MSDLSNKLVDIGSLGVLTQKLDARFNQKLLLINDIDYEALLNFDTDEIIFNSDNSSSILGTGTLDDMILD